MDQFSGESKPVTLPLGGEEVIASLLKNVQLLQKFRSSLVHSASVSGYVSLFDVV